MCGLQITLMGMHARTYVCLYESTLRLLVTSYIVKQSYSFPVPSYKVHLYSILLIHTYSNVQWLIEKLIITRLQGHSNLIPTRAYAC